MNRAALALGLATALLGGFTAADAHAAASPTYRIVNNITGGSLMPQDYGENSNDGIAMYAWDTSDTRGADVWRFTLVSDGSVMIRNIRTAKCLKPGGAFSGLTYLTQGTCNDSLEFQWTFQHRASDDQYKIVSRSSQQAISPIEGRDLNELVVLDAPSNIARNWWSVVEV
ncbi:RICIN domain-containing protein [Kitasatospora sp. NPDC057936]|uniref:RICIN domain-containing protein n=1 Tax=Kitasatospora sp. NPDC057936 TaxID=3346283 RepID=UPI0036D80884